MLDKGNAISIGCCRKRKQNTEEFESLNFHQTVRVINVLFTWQVEHGYRSCERCCNDFLCCLQANYPVLVINNTVWAHEWHRLHFGYLSKGGGVDVLHGECWMCACWGVWSFLVLQVKKRWCSCDMVKFPLSWQETWHWPLNLFVFQKKNGKKRATEPCDPGPTFFLQFQGPKNKMRK